MPHDLGYIVRGGRVPAALKKLTDFLHISPLLTDKGGRFTLGGFTTRDWCQAGSDGESRIKENEKGHDLSYPDCARGKSRGRT